MTIYKIKIYDDHVSIRLNLPKSVNTIDEEQAEDLESELHYAIEKVISKYYFK